MHKTLLFDIIYDFICGKYPSLKITDMEKIDENDPEDYLGNIEIYNHFRCCFYLNVWINNITISEIGKSNIIRKVGVLKPEDPQFFNKLYNLLTRKYHKSIRMI